MTPEEQLVEAVQQNDLDAATRALALHPELKKRLNDALPGLPFDATVIQPAVRWQNREMIALLQLAGADINTKTHWWAGGFSVLDFAEPAFVPYLIERGAKMTIHAAARLGDLEEVRRIVRSNKNAVNARGGDGQTPLHVASTVEIAEFLLDNGAEIDAKDIDHESTPAQYRIREHPEVARFLVSRGAKTDVFLAAAVGDIDRVTSIVDSDANAIHATIDEKTFPMKNRRAGGHIYIWTLGTHKRPHAIAREFGHDDVFNLLMSRSPESLQLTIHARMADADGVRALLIKNPRLISLLTKSERSTLAYATQDEDIAAVRILLGAGWPLDAGGQHNGTPLHWAAFLGNAELTRLILGYGPNLELRDSDHHGTPLEWAFHGSEHGYRCDSGDFVSVVNALLDAGAKMPKEFPASERVRETLRVRGIEA
jgi:ankyrin repeat protein